jgi:hypothetical protein
LQLFFLLEKIFLYVQTIIWYLSPTKYSVMLIVTCNCLFILYLCENLFFINLVPNVIDILICLIFFCSTTHQYDLCPKIERKGTRKEKKSIYWRLSWAFFLLQVVQDSFWVNLTLKLLWHITRNTLMHLCWKTPALKMHLKGIIFIQDLIQTVTISLYHLPHPPYTFAFSWY